MIIFCIFSERIIKIYLKLSFIFQNENSRFRIRSGLSPNQPKSGILVWNRCKLVFWMKDDHLLHLLWKNYQNLPKTFLYFPKWKFQIQDQIQIESKSTQIWNLSTKYVQSDVLCERWSSFASFLKELSKST